MSKRRVTLNLDEDVVEALEMVGRDTSMSAVANEALRESLESRAHRAALIAWINEMFDEHGHPTPEERAEVKAFLDAVQRGEDPNATTSAA